MANPHENLENRGWVYFANEETFLERGRDLPKVTLITE